MWARTGGPGHWVPADVVTAAVAGLVGALAAAVVFQVGDSTLVRSAGRIAGTDSIVGGWLAIPGLGLLLAVPFVAVLRTSVNPFVSLVISLTSRNDALRVAIVPLLNVSALGVTLFALGLLYGFLVVGVILFGYIRPGLATLVSGQTHAVPSIDPVSILGWTVYGGVTGLGYGLGVER